MEKMPPRTEPGGSAPRSYSQNGLTTLSPSRASDFKQCPQLFKFRTIDRIPEPPSVHQARGTAVHMALERLFEYAGEERTRDLLCDLFYEAWEELRAESGYRDLFETEEDEAEWSVESLDVIDNYLALEDPADITPLEREMGMKESLGDMTILGILDRIEENADGELIITDYKTGRAPPERFIRSAFFALKIYALLIRNRFGRTPSEVRLMYLGSGTVYSLPIMEQALAGMLKQLEALWYAINRAIQTQNFPTRLQPLCNWCSYMDICPAFEDLDLNQWAGYRPHAEAKT